MKKKLVALDIDGTLLNSEARLTPRTIKAVKKLQGRGVYVALATGRRFSSCVEIMHKLEIELPLITHNGAMVMEGEEGRVLYDRPIETNAVFPALQEIMDMEIDYYIHSRDLIFYCREPVLKWGKNHIQKNKDFIERRDINEFSGEKMVHRLVLVGVSEQIKSYMEKRPNQDGKIRHIHFKSQYSDLEFVEVLHKEANKAQGLKFLAQKLDIAPEEIVAVGDEKNDVEMLGWAGMGVAMGNAEEDVKKRADWVCGHNDEEGLAEFLEKI